MSPAALGSFAVLVVLLVAVGRGLDPLLFLGLAAGLFLLHGWAFGTDPKPPTRVA
jgi:hydrogenase/urease accessory protein HupE